MQEPILMPFQHEPFNGDTFVCEEFLNLKKEYDIKIAIETGSCMYSTTQWFGDNFDKVYSVEINEDFAKYGRHKIADKNNVMCFIDDSISFIGNLKMLLPKDQRCIYFLDAHWGNVCPLLGELEQIANVPTTQPPIIVIHDFYTGDAELGYDDYNGQPFTFEWIEPYVEKIEMALNCEYTYHFNSQSVGAKRGVIYLTPKTEKCYCENISIEDDAIIKCLDCGKTFINKND